MQDNNINNNENKITDIELDVDIEKKILEASEKNVGYAAIRPSITDRLNFAKTLKKLSEDTGSKISQTDAFSIILNAYLNSDDEKVEKEARSKNIDFTSTLFSVKYHTEHLLNTFKDMEKIAQDTININIDNSAIQLKNKDVEIEKLKKELEACNNKITELEKTNNLFDD